MMATKSKDKTKANSLSRYFKDLNESDLDSDDSDDSLPPKESEKTHNNAENETEQGEPEDLALETSVQVESHSTDNRPAKPQKLPSAHDCLNAKSSPSFLKLSQKKEINWDQSHMKLLEEGEESDVVDYKTNAVPPPSDYEPVTDPGIKVVDSEGRKRKTAADELEDQMVSRKAYKVENPPKQEES